MKMIETLADTLRPWVRSIQASASIGNKTASEIINLYEMHWVSPSDPAAAGLCRAALKEWLYEQAALLPKENEDE
jgi:hypothetical protein